MRRLALLAGLVLGLAAAPPAVAKHLRALTACGADRCVTSHDRGLLSAFVDVGPPSDRPGGPAPFYRLTLLTDEWNAKSSWAPSADRLLGEDGTWMAVRPAVARALARLTAGLAPRPAAQLPGFPMAATNRGGRSAAPVVLLLAAAAALLVLAALVTLRRARPPAAAPPARWWRRSGSPPPGRRPAA